MIAHKFLRSGRHGPFSGFEWPEPGEWVRPGAEPDLCRNAIHACRVRDLPWWMSEELWEIELDGDVHVGEHKIVAPAGRLRARRRARGAPGTVRSRRSDAPGTVTPRASSRRARRLMSSCSPRAGLRPRCRAAGSD